MTGPSPVERLLAALDDRTGLPSALRGHLATRLAPGAAASHALGSAIVVLLLLQAATGAALFAHYAPTTTDAWASLYWLQANVPGGALLRSVHRVGMSALVLLLCAHLLLALLQRAYRKPRELTWWGSLLLLQLVLAFAVTGNPLPWDQRGYWGSRVETGILGSLPVVGGALRELVLGGNDYGNLTLLRLSTLHALVLPGALLALLLLSALVLLRHGLTGSGAAGEGLRLFPDALARSLAFSLLVLAAVVGLAATHPAELGAPADPASSYLARPEWYFLPLNQLLGFFRGGAELVGTVILPGAAVSFLFALPFLDPGGPRGRRRLALSGACGLGAAVAVLLALGLVHDAQDPALAKGRQRDALLSARTVRLAQAGIPPDGALAMLQDDPRSIGEKLFGRRCAGCHPIGGEGARKPKGPDLAGYLSQPWLLALLRDPGDPRFFGRTKLDEMEPYSGKEPAQVVAVAGLLAALREHPEVAPDELPPALSAGREAYDALACESCHELAPGEEGAAPNLSGYGSDRWLVAFLKEPGAARFYGEANQMPAFAGKLSEQQLLAVVAFLRTLETLPLAPEVAAREAKPAEAPAAALDE